MMEIIENNDNSETKVVSFKTKAEKEKEEHPRIPIPDLLQKATEANLTDVVLVGRDKDGGFVLSASCENGMLTFFMLKKALFAIEHSIL